MLVDVCLKVQSQTRSTLIEMVDKYHYFKGHPVRKIALHEQKMPEDKVIFSQFSGTRRTS